MKSLFTVLVLSLLSSQAHGFSRCKITFDASQSMVQGTGYKFSEKKGVQASFKKFSVSEASGSSIPSLLKGIIVNVDLASVDSGDAGRDINLRNSLFANLKGGPQAAVVVESVEAKKAPSSKDGSEVSKTYQIHSKLTLNGVTRAVVFHGLESKGQLVARAQVDVVDYMMSPALEALKALCGPLHTGKDGKSKTWSDFELKVTAAVVRKDCH